MKFDQAKYAVANTFGTLGYISIIIQWTWCLITLGQPLFTAENPFFLPQAPIPEARMTFDFGIFAPFVPLIALFAVVVLVFLTIITVIKLPKAVGETGARVTHVTAVQIVRRTHQHFPLPDKKRKKLSQWVIWLLKAAIVFIPFGLVFVTPPIEGLSTQLITAVAFVCVAFSIGYFLLQLILAVLLRLDLKKVW